MKGHLRDKRRELIWALAAPDQGYNYSEIATMFGLNRSSVMRIINNKPKEYKPKWVKVRD